jgi:hypothetical protein
MLSMREWHLSKCSPDRCITSRINPRKFSDESSIYLVETLLIPGVNEFAFYADEYASLRKKALRLATVRTRLLRDMDEVANLPFVPNWAVEFYRAPAALQNASAEPQVKRQKTDALWSLIEAAPTDEDAKDQRVRPSNEEVVAKYMVKNPFCGRGPADGCQGYAAAAAKSSRWTQRVAR